MRLLRVVAFSYIEINSVFGLPKYQQQIPNGEFTGVLQSRSLGHYNSVSRENFVEVNEFALDFKAAGHVWTSELCNKDSDGDGFTNGEELGDPRCLFDLAEPNSLQLISGILSHPGDKNSTPENPNFIDFQEHENDFLVLMFHCMALSFAWMVLFPCGVITIWVDKMKAESDWMFQHSIIMSAASFFCLAGIVVIGVLGSGPMLVYTSLHVQIGAGVVVLMLLNLAAVIIKPSEDSDWIALFGFLHRSIGQVLVLLTPFALLSGFRIGFPESYQKIGFLTIAIGGITAMVVVYSSGRLLAWYNWKEMQKEEKEMLLRDKRDDEHDEAIVANKKKKEFAELRRSQELSAEKAPKKREIRSDRRKEKHSFERKVEKIPEEPKKKRKFDRNRLRKLTEQRIAQKHQEKTVESSTISEVDDDL